MVDTTHRHSGSAWILRVYEEHRFWLMVIVAALALLALTLVLSADEADAWTTSNYAGVEGDFHSGIVEYYRISYTSGPSVRTFEKYSSSSPYNHYYYYSGTSYYYYYYDRAYFGVKVGDMDDSTYINRAWFNVVVSTEYNFDSYMYVYMLKIDAQKSGAQALYESLSYGDYLGRAYVSSTGTLSFAMTGTSLAHLRDYVAGDQSHVYFAFTGSSSSGDYIMFDPSASYIRMEYDASPPNTPRLNGLSTYNSGTRVRLTWSTTTDAPTGGNVGMHAQGYEIGIFDYPSHSPVRTTGWFDGTQGNRYLYNFADGQTYYFKLRARDASGIVSPWSYEAWTTIDNSPPSVPVLKQEPLFTSGTTNVLEWAASTDAGVGVNYYRVQRSLNSDFSGAATYQTSATSHSTSSLTSGWKYYYRVAAVDVYGLVSDWSVPQSTTMDATAPSVPVVHAEPAYTQGTENTFRWSPSVDGGIGVSHYEVQVAWSPAFSPGTVVLDQSITNTYLTATNLQHNRFYYIQVRSVDAFGYISSWSAYERSRQDDMGPEAPGLDPLPLYHTADPVLVTWDPPMDSGIGVIGWYRVLWNNQSDMLGDGDEREDLVGHSLKIHDLAINETWYIQVTAYDQLGNVGEVAETNTTVDGIAPTEPGVNMPGMFTPGPSWTIGWTPSTDDLSGVDHYMVNVYSRPTGGMVYSDTTATTSMDVPGLADGSTYWAHVIAVDAAGNANASAMVSTTMDASPPSMPILARMPQFSPGTSVTPQWGPSTDAGAGGVEYMLEWAFDDGFTVGLGSSGWITVTSHQVIDLSDGAPYYFRATARDSLGHVSMYSPMEVTTMDASPPPVPVMMAGDAYVPGPAVALEWSRVEDGSGTMVTYQVWVYDNADGTGVPMDTSPWLADSRYLFMDIDPDVTHWYSVVSRDHLGWTSGPSEVAMVTIDTTGPAAASVDDLDEFTPGTGLKVTWVAGTDDGVGNVVCRLVVYSDEDMRIPVHSSEWTNAGEANVYGLTDGVTYWFVVQGADGFGNKGPASHPATTMMDASAPMLTADAELFGPTGDVTGTCIDAASGVDTVEVSSDGTTWIEATVTAGTWSVSINDLNDGKVWVRATDMVGNMASPHVLTMADATAPAVSITSPTEGADVSSAVMISGSIADANLHGYSVDYQRSGSSDWTSVQPEQTTTGVNGVLATWLTAGLSGGDYTLRVTATDGVGLDTTSTVTVTLKGAKLSIGATDISFSDTHPLPDETVTVMVTVRNTGDSPAEGITVTVYDNGKAVGEGSGVTVPAHGTATVAVKAKATEGSQEFTARASSTLYDTGEMETGAPLKTIDKEGALENVGGILGLVALIIALIALLLVLMMKMDDKGGPEPVEEIEENIVVDPIVEMETLEPEMPNERPRTH